MSRESGALPKAARRTGCVPEGQADFAAIVELDAGNIVFKDGRDIVLRKLVFGKDNEETCLARGTVSNHHKLLRAVHFCRRGLCREKGQGGLRMRGGGRQQTREEEEREC